MRTTRPSAFLLLATAVLLVCSPANERDVSRPSAPGPAGVQMPATVAGQPAVLQGVAACPERDPHALIPSPAAAERPKKIWQGDINGDGREDVLLVDRAACGNWGDCPFALFVACGDGDPIPVWTQYAQNVRVAPSGSSWQDLIVIGRSGHAGDDYAYTARWRFDGKGYREVEGTRQRLP
jgi:hypothetical protein